MKYMLIVLAFSLLSIFSCKKDAAVNQTEIEGFNLLSELSGHWVGTNETVFGIFDWFAFDFRPISSSHLHSIYEGATNQNIITSIFVADHNGEQKIMARNGGWLGTQYRATYFVLDRSEESDNRKYYRLVDAVGGAKRAFMEFQFENDTLYFDAYKDNSGQLDEPIHHMGFKGTNFNPEFAQPAMQQFNFPKSESEVDLNGKFTNLLDPDSALFLEEDTDPFPRANHGHLSDLGININKDVAIESEDLLLYFSKKPLIDSDGNVDFDNINTQVLRTIRVRANEAFYLSTYLHPETYFITAFSDNDSNFYPSTGDFYNASKEVVVTPESNGNTEIDVRLQL